MTTILLSVFLSVMTLTTAVADTQIPYGVWACEGNGHCIHAATAKRDGDMVTVDAIIRHRDGNHLGKLVRHCDKGVNTAYGVPGLAEDWPLQDSRNSFEWLCALGD